ncbi:MAG: hypothetical protein IKN04_22745 [Clostridia bacterium]|nr:hypothetical protein [Clostridia bacterium]MBR6185400.1 hypothetical protein [Clostridia bacterium]
MNGNKLEKVFLNERFMAAVCIMMAAAGAASLVFCFREQDAFEIFALLVKLVTAVTMFLAFRSFKWDAAKGLMGGVLFCLMYQDAHLALARLWSEQNFDAYLASGVQGSLFLAGAGMNLLMTVIITANHFFINYSTHGNPKNVILNRIALVFKLVVCILLIVTNSLLGFSSALRWTHSVQYLMDVLLLVLVACLEAQFDSFNALRQELKKLNQERKAGK